MSREKVGRKRRVEEEEEEAGSGKVELSLGGGDGNGAATVGARSEAKSREAQSSGLGNTTAFSTEWLRVEEIVRKRKRKLSGPTGGEQGWTVQRGRRRRTTVPLVVPVTVTRLQTG